MRSTSISVMAIAGVTLLGCNRTPDPATEAGPAMMTAPAATASETKDAFPPELLVVGTEPFWTVKAGSTALEFTTPETVSQPMQWIGGRELLDGMLVMRGGEGERAYRLSVEVASCSDGMSDLEYPYTAEFVLGTQTYKGCARDASVAVPPQ
jgi:uncharacterized membrane protein